MIAARIKQRVFEVVSVARPGDRPSLVFDWALIALILANIVVFVLESVPSLAERHGTWFAAFEAVSVIVFSIEYIARVWTSTHDPRFRSPVTGRVRFVLTPMALVDLLAILPWYLPLLGVDLRALRSLRIFRILRLAKLGRYTSALNIMGGAIRRTREELVITGAIIAVLLLLASTGIYYAEREAQPDKFGNIPEAAWWAVATMTTVGYGDVYPITPTGRFFGAVVAILGIGLIALPTGILGTGFADEARERKRGREPRVCPRCGEELG